MFETARSIVHGISAVIAAKATAYPSISSSTARGSAARRDRAWSSDSDARATESASPSCPSSAASSLSANPSSAGVWSPTPTPWQRTSPGASTAPIGASSAS